MSCLAQYVQMVAIAQPRGFNKCVMLHSSRWGE
jgi:hypothetical protein